MRLLSTCIQKRHGLYFIRMLCQNVSFSQSKGKYFAMALVALTTSLNCEGCKMCDIFGSVSGAKKNLINFQPTLFKQDSEQLIW